MRVTIRLFAGPREALGADELTMELPAGTTVGGLLAILVRQYPVLQEYAGFLHFAVNRRYVDLETELHSGDEVVCVPPVGGG